MASESESPLALDLAILSQEPLLASCEQSVIDTVLSSRAPSTRLLYANRWKLFYQWCQTQGELLENWLVAIILRFLQSLLDAGRCASSLKVYAAAISAGHVRVNNQTMGSHYLVSQFLKGAQRRRPSRVTVVPSWDLTLASRSVSGQVEPIGEAELRWLSAKTAFLLAITSAKRVGELHALSVSQMCLRWYPGGSGVTLLPNPSFLPKRGAYSHVNQAIELAAFSPPSSSQQATELSEWLCPVRTLKAYMAATVNLTTVCLLQGLWEKSTSVFLSGLSRWFLHAYRSQGLPAPSNIRCHSTCSVSTSWAALKGVSLQDICAVATWESSCTAAHYYRINVAAQPAVATAVLSTASMP